MDGRLVLRSLYDRYTFIGDLENDNSNGTKIADNWLISGKYDYFISKQRYYGVGLSFERDKFTDLNLRTTLSPGPGFVFHSNSALLPALNLNWNMIVSQMLQYIKQIRLIA